MRNRDTEREREQENPRTADYRQGPSHKNFLGHAKKSFYF